MLTKPSATKGEDLDITSKKTRNLTPLKLSEDAWKRLFSDETPYDPDKVFYGVPDENTEGSSNIFDKVYDVSGRYQGRMITGIPQTELPK